MAPSKAQSRFQADLKSAAERNIPNVSDINKGDAEDEFTFVFTHSIPPDADQYEIRVQPQGQFLFVLNEFLRSLCPYKL